MDIFETFRAAANPGQAAQMSAYMRGQFEYLGIKTPDRRLLSRDFLKNSDKKSVDWDFVFKCWGQPEREFQYLAVDYLLKRKSLFAPDDVPRIKKLALTKSWWDTVDSLDVLIGEIALRHSEVNETILEWSVDGNFWLRRLAIDHQLTRKEKTDAALFERILVNNLGQKEFFINKAIGWSLREYSKADPAWVRGFIERYRDRMAPLSIKEGSKYI